MPLIYRHHWDKTRLAPIRVRIELQAGIGLEYLVRFYVYFCYFGPGDLLERILLGLLHRHKPKCVVLIDELVRNLRLPDLECVRRLLMGGTTDLSDTYNSGP
jgi:hypothetical protein